MTTYGTALTRLQTELARHTADDLVERSGAVRSAEDRIVVRCLGRDYVIGLPEGDVLGAAGEPVDEHLAILILLYLTEAGGRPLEDRWVAFEQLSGGSGYLGSFRGRVVGPLLRTFGADPAAMLTAGAEMDGTPLAMGDAGVALAALPRVRIAFVLWRGDDEFAPSASVVFDASIEGYLDAEAATVLAELAVHRMIEVASARPA